MPDSSSRLQARICTRVDVGIETRRRFRVNVLARSSAHGLGGAGGERSGGGGGRRRRVAQLVEIGGPALLSQGL